MAVTTLYLPETDSLFATEVTVRQDEVGDLVITQSWNDKVNEFYVNPEAVETFISAIRKAFPLTDSKSEPKPSQAYKGNGDHEWELVLPRPADDENGATDRLRVPGGWLYCVTHNDMENPSVVFVPMPEVVKHKV